MTIIKVRRGINGFRYSACDDNGYFIGNFEKLSEIRKRWDIEIKSGYVKLIRELDKQPDMSKEEAVEKAIKQILRNWSNAQ